MVLPAQFQLGLELTNIVSPFTNALSALGSLALVDAIKRSGSDVITEIKLASLLGRHRIDPVIELHFKEAVAKSDQVVISRYLDIILESGSGPTVQEALKNPALFSMVIQLSALAYVHETESLANAIVMAIENILRQSDTILEYAPDYVSLLGTVRVCQQQTAAFQWSCLYDAVEQKILTALSASPKHWHGKGAKRRKIQGPTSILPPSVLLRGLPFVVLQSLMMWLRSLQSLPEHRILHAKCDTGISTIVVWCYHVLGLNVTVRLGEVDISFGDGGSSNIDLEASKAEDVGASILDPVAPNEPLFSLSNSEEDVTVGLDNRASAYGFGKKVISQVTECGEDFRYCSHWIIGHGMMLAERDENPENPGNLDTIVGESNASLSSVIKAGRFLFSLDAVDGDFARSIRKAPLKRIQVMRMINWPALVAILLAFARIRSLDHCKTIPLSLDVHRGLNKNTCHIGTEVDGPDHCFSLMNGFEILCRLLLGNSFSKDYIEPAVLISSRGWSIVLDIVDAIDLNDVSTETFRVLQGVPSRRGIRKTRIIDGPTDSRLPITTGKILDKDHEIMYFPGVGTAQRGPVLVGSQSGDAFSVVQVFSWKFFGRDEKKFKLGFREMHDERLCFDRVRACSCLTKETDSLGRMNDKIYFDAAREHVLDGVPFSYFEGKWRPDEKQKNISEERVFVGRFAHGDRTEALVPLPRPSAPNDVWFFYVTQNPAARWLQLNDLYERAGGPSTSLILRGNDCCVSCALNIVPDPSRLSLVLL